MCALMPTPLSKTPRPLLSLCACLPLPRVRRSPPRAAPAHALPCVHCAKLQEAANDGVLAADAEAFKVLHHSGWLHPKEDTLPNNHPAHVLAVRWPTTCRSSKPAFWHGSPATTGRHDGALLTFCFRPFRPPLFWAKKRKFQRQAKPDRSSLTLRTPPRGGDRPKRETNRDSVSCVFSSAP
jgi:hypothetical protein